MIGRENGDSQEIAERKQKDEVLASQFLVADRLLDLKRGGTKKEILKGLPEVVQSEAHFFLLRDSQVSMNCSQAANPIYSETRASSNSSE